MLSGAGPFSFTLLKECLKFRDWIVGLRVSGLNHLIQVGWRDSDSSADPLVTNCPGGTKFVHLLCSDAEPSGGLLDVEPLGFLARKYLGEDQRGGCARIAG